MSFFALMKYDKMALAALLGAAMLGTTAYFALAQEVKHPAKPHAHITAPAPTPQSAPTAQAPALPTPDPLSGDWRLIWLSKSNTVSAIHFANIERQPDMAAGSGTFVNLEGKECHLDFGLAYKVYGQIPNGDQLVNLNYIDTWKMIAHCDDGTVEFDLVALSSGGQITAIGRAVIHKKDAPADSSFVLMQR